MMMRDNESFVERRFIRKMPTKKHSNADRRAADLDPHAQIMFLETGLPFFDCVCTEARVVAELSPPARCQRRTSTKRSRN
jgi:hypothetical protein